GSADVTHPRVRRVGRPDEYRLHVRRNLPRRPHRRAPGPRRRERRRDPPPPHLLDVADLGDHHAVLDLLGRSVRRRDHLDPVQHSRRALVGGDDLRRLPDGAEREGRRSADRRLYRLLHRRLHRDPPLDLSGPRDRAFRAALRAGRILRRLSSDLLQLRRHGQGVAAEGHRRHDARLCARRRRAGYGDGSVAHDVRIHGTPARVRLPDRRHRTVRGRRDPSHHGRGIGLQGQDREDQCARRSRYLEGPAAILDDRDPQFDRRLLDGDHPRGRDAGVLHELRARQALLAQWSQVRDGRNRGRVRARDRRPRCRHERASADADARYPGLAHGGGSARRASHLGPAARPASVRRTEGLRLGPHRVHLPQQRRRADRGADHRAILRRDPARPLQHHRADHPGDLRGRRLHGSQRAARHLGDAGLRGHRLPVQEAELPARPAGPGARAGRHGGERIPAGHALVGGQHADLLGEPARRLDRHPGAAHAVLAADLHRGRAAERRQAGGSPGRI
ncbi:MAG: Tripartite tricarboxylate transporter TctA family, partial [uncultured Microvirga sp.]